LSPKVESRLDCAATALRVERPPYPLASEILGDLAPIASNRVAFCNLAADLAIKLQKRGEAEAWILAARRLQPSNELHRLNLAVLRLDSTNATLSAEARVTLQQLAANTNFFPNALRCLVSDSLARREFSNACHFSKILLSQRQAAFGDQLRHVEILHAAAAPEFGPYLEALERQAATNAAEACELSTLLIRQGRAAGALEWLDQCPKETQERQPGLLARVECLLALGNWDRVETLLKERPWADFEPMRLAFLSQAAFELGDATAAETRWRTALGQAHRRLGSLMWLAAKAEGWCREPARVDALWEIVHQFPSERWALRELARGYLASGNTRGLHQVYAKLSALDPAEPTSKNNFATTAFLLKTNLARAHEATRDLYSAHPDDPVFVSTYAYSLHLQDRTREGLALLEHLPAEALTRPSIALYYAALLAADGQLAKAREYFAHSRSAALLPEERALLTIP
jgi:predicted Zn-dependent protease